ncbi:MAG: Type 1 glutamine amidotransferase-like domain-containing protein [Clostridia bacterium]
MKKLFLVSSFAQVGELLPKFEKNLKGKRVTFIPTASRVDMVSFCVSKGTKALEKLGLTVDELELSTATYDEIYKKITTNDYIYLSGGNTFFLMQELIRTGADKIIIDEVKKGKLYIGESGGAMVTAENLEYVTVMDPTKKAPLLKGFAGMNLVDFSVVPHRINFPFILSAQKMIRKYSKTLKIMAISNKEAIIVWGDNVKIIKK